jgi:hypothetical protein
MPRRLVNPQNSCNPAFLIFEVAWPSEIFHSFHGQNISSIRLGVSMKFRIVIFVLLILLRGAVVQGQTNSQQQQQWQAQAVQKHPDLGVQGSDFNKRFLAEYARRRTTEPHFFDGPKWPMTLADEVAASGDGGLRDLLSGQIKRWWAGPVGGIRRLEISIDKPGTPDRADRVAATLQ